MGEQNFVDETEFLSKITEGKAWWDRKRVQSVVKHLKECEGIMPDFDTDLAVNFFDLFRWAAERGQFNEIHNYVGPVDIVISCVTAEKNDQGKYMPHPYKIGIKGDQGSAKRGYCYYKINRLDESGIVKFPRLGLHCVKKKEIPYWLELRQQHNIDPFNSGFDHKDDFKKNGLDLNAVRLCFQVWAYRQVDQFGHSEPMKLQPVVTEPIKNKKQEDLMIYHMTPSSASCTGGTEVALLCEKVHKGDIAVQFIDRTKNWSADAAITDKPGVFRQQVIVFNTPQYVNQTITEPVEIEVRLRRPSDKKKSEPHVFKIMPVGYAEDKFEIHQDQKRKREDSSNDIQVKDKLFQESKKRIALNSDAKIFRQYENQKLEACSRPPNLAINAFTNSIEVGYNSYRHQNQHQKSTPTTYKDFNPVNNSGAHWVHNENYANQWQNQSNQRQSCAYYQNPPIPNPSGFSNNVPSCCQLNVMPANTHVEVAPVARHDSVAVPPSNFNQTDYMLPNNFNNYNNLDIESQTDLIYKDILSNTIIDDQLPDIDLLSDELSGVSIEEL